MRRTEKRSKIRITMLPTILVNVGLITAALLSAASLVQVKAGTSATNHQQEGQQISIRMPDIRPDHAEQYLCIARRLPVNENGQYIVGFNPKADASRVHHMLMYGCQRPGIFQRDSPNFVWDCGEMQAPANNEQIASFEKGPVCSGAQSVLYGWALDAPALKLPKDTGFKVGGADNDIRFLVLQVHYGHYNAFQKLPDLTDNSGIVLDMKQNTPESGITRQAGVLLLYSLGRVVKGKSKHDIWCDFNDDIEIHPFRYRVHTHKLGTKVLAAKITSTKSNDKYGKNDNLIIGSGDPQKPQMFYPVKEKELTIKKGDQIYARCEFNNNKTRDVNIGATGEDEMCNFYMMYWTESSNLLSKSTCYGYNPPKLPFLWQ